jgi:hypothetical protein
MPVGGNGTTVGITADVEGVAGVGLIDGMGEIPGVELTGGREFTGVEVITGEGEAAGTDVVGLVRVQPDKAIALIPINNLKYFMLNCK